MNNYEKINFFWIGSFDPFTNDSISDLFALFTYFKDDLMPFFEKFNLVK